MQAVQSLPPIQPGSQLPPDRSVILAVIVNGLEDDQGAVFLQDEGGNLFAPASFLQQWNLQSGGLRMLAPDGAEYFGLSGIAGLSYVWNQEAAELEVSAAAEAFLSTNLNIGSGRARKVAPYSPGAYLNYDLSLTHSPGFYEKQGLVDVALFRGEGLFTSSFITGSVANARLLTTWQKDRIDAVKTLRIGDSYNSTGAWGRGVLFGGIQYGTNFSIRPEFITSAMPSISGKALLPSTVDVYVNRALRSRQNVNAGPFSIQNLPVISGAGEVQIVVKDLLGREQIITQPFFASPNLLRKGLVEDSFELGWLRENYGLKSGDYSDLFSTMTYRKGLSNALTGEVRVELQKNLKAAGATVAAKLPGFGSVIEASFAFSDVPGLSEGRMGSVTYSYLGKRWSANTRLQLNSTGFRQVGSNPDSLPLQIASAQLAAPIGKGTLSVNYLRHLNQGESMTRLINFNYAHRISDAAFANFTLLKPLSEKAGMTAAFTLTFLFDQKHVGSATVTRAAEGTSLYSDFQKATPRDEGTGYRLAMRNGDSAPRQEASVSRNQSFGSFQADVVHLHDDVSARLGAQGAVAMMGGEVFYSRGLDDGFAVVQTTDMPGVPVYLENQIVGHTNKSGRVVVNNLRAYQDNRISIDPVTLPMEASFDAVVQTVVPRRQGGVLVDFAIRRVRSATLTIVQADGTLLPPWTSVEVAGMEQAYISGNRGEVFVDLPNPKNNRVIARPEGGPICELSVDQPEPGSTVPFLGPLQCATSH